MDRHHYFYYIDCMREGGVRAHLSCTRCGGWASRILLHDSQSRFWAIKSNIKSNNVFNKYVSNIDNDMKEMFSALWGCMFLWLMVDKMSVKRLWQKLFFKSFSVVGSQVWDGNYMITVKVLLLIEEEVSAFFSGFGSKLAWTCEFSKYLKLQGTQNWSAGFGFVEVIHNCSVSNIFRTMA